MTLDRPAVTGLGQDQKSISRRSQRHSEKGRQVLGCWCPRSRPLTARRGENTPRGVAFLDRFPRPFSARRPPPWHLGISGAPGPANASWATGAEGPGSGWWRAPDRAAFIPPLPGTGPDRRRRGARPCLQAGGPGILQCPRHGGGCGAISGSFPVLCLASATPSGGKPRQMPSRAPLREPLSLCRGRVLVRADTHACGHGPEIFVPSTCGKARRRARCRRFGARRCSLEGTTGPRAGSGAVDREQALAHASQPTAAATRR